MAIVWGVLACGILVALAYVVVTSFAMRRLREGASVVRLSMGDVEYAWSGGEGPTVLYLHGSPGGYDRAAFEHPSYRTLAISRPGYLRTPLAVGASPRAQAEAVVALLDELGLESVMVMAASGGGPSALALAGLYPERVDRLVLVEPVSHALELPPIPAPMRSDLGVLLFSWLVRPPTLARILILGDENQRLALRSPASRAKLTGMVRGTWPPSRRMSGWENDAEQFGRLEPPRPFDVPCLIVHGTLDANVPFADSRRLHELLPHSTLHAVEGADHFMPLTHDDELRRVILEFLETSKESP